MVSVLVDFHHSSLLRSFYLTFAERFGWDVFRPIGLEWYEEGLWDVFPSLDTATQYLSLDQAYRPGDSTPPLNLSAPLYPGTRDVDRMYSGVFPCLDPGGDSVNYGATLEYVRDNPPDLVIASLPQHIVPLQRLSAQLGSQFVVQLGNEWPLDSFSGLRVMASLSPRPYSTPQPVIFYHQEFDLSLFRRTFRAHEPHIISSYVNCLPESPSWSEFLDLERMFSRFWWLSYGGQCRDGNCDGPQSLSRSMLGSLAIAHLKPSGDGYGHILHNAFACGRPVITRVSWYRGMWGEHLLESSGLDGTYIDLDRHSRSEVGDMLATLAQDDSVYRAFSDRVRQRFDTVVNFDADAVRLRQWLDVG